MSEFVTTLNFDTEFHAPCDCPPEGDVSCRVVCSECQVIDRWDRMLTFRARLLLRVTIHRGGLRCTFDREIIVKESVWFDGWLDLLSCEVKAAICRCVLNRGRLFCNGTVSVQFHFRRPSPCCHCWRNPCECCHHDHSDRHDHDDCCQEESEPCWEPERCDPCTAFEPNHHHRTVRRTFCCKPVRVCRR